MSDENNIKAIGGCLTAAAIVGVFFGVCEYSMRKYGIDVKPAAVADFNKDGRSDIIYLSGSKDTTNLIYVDGLDAGEKGGKWLRHKAGEIIGPVLLRAHRYAVGTPDENGDGNSDLRIEDIDTSDVEVWLGDGKGNLVKDLEERPSYVSEKRVIEDVEIELPEIEPEDDVETESTESTDIDNEADSADSDGSDSDSDGSDGGGDGGD